MNPSAVWRVTPKIAHHTSWIGCRNLKKSVIEVGMSGHRVVAAAREGMAAGDAGGAHPGSSQPPIALDRLVRVVRAGGVVTTGRGKDPGKGELITANQEQQQVCHGLVVASLSAACDASALRSANDISSAAGRAIRTTSYRIPPRRRGESFASISARATSRSRRRTRFRSMAPLMLRLTVTPTRVWSAWLGTAKPTSALPW